MPMPMWWSQVWLNIKVKRSLRGRFTVLGFSASPKIE